MRFSLRNYLVSIVLVAVMSVTQSSVDPLGATPAFAQSPTVQSITIDRSNLREEKLGDKTTVTVTLDKPTTQRETFTIVYPTDGQITARHNVDFTGPTEVKIKKGETTRTFNIRIFDDREVEDVETGEIGILGSSSSVQFTIISDDVPPPPPTKIMLFMDDKHLNEGSSPSASKVKVVLDQPAPAGGLVMKLEYDDGSRLAAPTAEVGKDFTGPSSITIPAGFYSNTFNIKVIDDEIHEPGTAGLEYSRITVVHQNQNARW